MPRKTTVTPTRKGLYYCSSDWHPDGPPEATYFVQGMHPYAGNADGCYKVDSGPLADCFSVCDDAVHMRRAVRWMLARYRRITMMRVDV